MFMHFDTRRGAEKFEKWLVQRFPGPRNAGEIKKYGGRVAPTEYDFALFLLDATARISNRGIILQCLRRIPAFVK
jgi:hypothetical protein